MAVSVLLPTLNEERNIKETIERARIAIPGAEIIVIDGLSEDRTVEIAEKSGARIILEKTKGKASAIRRALNEIDSEYAIMVDADRTYPIEDIPKFLELLNKFDIVMGSRFRGKLEEGSMSALNNFGNRMISLWASILYLRSVSDVCTGMWGFRKKAYKSIKITAKNFELEGNLFAQTVKKKFKLTETPINYAKRGGHSKLHVLDGVKICLFLLKERLSP